MLYFVFPHHNQRQFPRTSIFKWKFSRGLSSQCSHSPHLASLRSRINSSTPKVTLHSAKKLLLLYASSRVKMSQVLNVLNLEIGDPSGSQSLGSGSSGSLASSAPTIVFVQDLVNEVTASVLQASGSSAGSGVVDEETNSSSSNSSSSPKRPLEKESSKSSKRLKKSSGAASGSSLITSAPGTGSKLEQRLGGILCCAVCLDLPKSSVYQVCCTLFYFYYYLFSLAKLFGTKVGANPIISQHPKVSHLAQKCFTFGLDTRQKQTPFSVKIR